MKYIETENKHQTILLPNKLDNYITQENPTRIIDAFINTLNLKQLGFTKTTPTTQGRPAYHPNMILKLWIYGYHNKIRSSRKLAKETTRNLEAIWLCQKLQPDFRTISDFRKDNIKPIKQVFIEWNLFCDKLELFGKEYQSIDGSKFKASNAKDQNFTLPKLDDRIKRIDTHIEQYFTELEKNDKKEQDERKFTKEEIQQKIVELIQRKTKYENYREELEKTGETQKSLTDPEAKLMKFKGDYNVGYNVQTAVDSKHHLIAEFEVTNHPSDHGLINQVAGKVKQVFNLDLLETTEDKGYRDKQDMVNCLEQGIVPNVHPAKEFDHFELETFYEPVEVSGAQKQSVKPEDLKLCLRAGVVSEVYGKFVKDMEVVEVSVFEDVLVEELPVFENEVQRLEYARGGFFVRDLERNVVYCPGGEKLRFCGSSRRRGSGGGVMFYCNKLGCERCLSKCCGSKFLVVRFGVGQVVVGCRLAGRRGVRWRVRRKVGVRKVVRFKFFPDEKKLDNRKCLSEHPFGSVKFWNDGSYLLLRGKEKVTGELALSFLAYNMKRVLNILGFDRIMAAFGPCKTFFYLIFPSKTIIL
jgi:transposase